MAPYRDSARWGEPIATHRTAALSWLAGALLAFPAAYLCYHLAKGGKPGSFKLWIGALVFVGLGLWMVVEFVRLRSVAVRRYSRGFIYEDGKVRHEVDWSDVLAVEAQYVPGLTGGGAANPSNLVGLVVTFAGGRVSLHKELDDFHALVDHFRKHTPAAWTDVTIANLMQRS